MLKDISPHLYLSSHNPGAWAGFGAAVLPEECQEDRGGSVLPSRDTVTAWPKGIYFPLERSGMRNGFQRHRPLVFAKKLNVPAWLLSKGCD